MDFFGAQDAARSNTFRLVVLFVLAVASLIAVTNLMLMLFLGLVDATQIAGPSGVLSHFDWGHFVTIGALVALIVAAGSLYKVAVLSRGGAAVAEALGGRIVAQDTDDPVQRRLLNIVEEMAIASGVPVPPVYVLDQESGINAFAAGLSPANAVIGLTRGAAGGLSRDQLQGVIAHEFSHILNGDMRLNIRLAGALHGVLLIGLIGYHLTHAGGRGRGSRGSAGLMLLGLGLMAVGYGGTFFSNLIKASVSRQREFLADASAVQFTRDPSGIAGALKRIGAAGTGGLLGHPDAPEMSHAYFAQGIKSRLGRLSATHPPLDDRIRRIDPAWDGRYPIAAGAPPLADSRGMEPGRSAGPAASLIDPEGPLPSEDAARVASEAIAQVGHPHEAHLRYAESLIGTIPPALHWAAREPYGARALVYALLLHRDPQKRRRQLARLERAADLGIHGHTLQLVEALAQTGREHRLPLLDLSMPALRQLSPRQYLAFKENLEALIREDQRIDLFEWCLARILLCGLAPDFGVAHDHSPLYDDCARLPRECALVLSLLAQVEGDAPAGREGSFLAARKSLGLEDLERAERSEISHRTLDQSLERLARLTPRAKRTFLEACAAGILADERITPSELEVIRAVGAAIDCPVPPMLTTGAPRSRRHADVSPELDEYRG